MHSSSLNHTLGWLLFPLARRFVAGLNFSDALVALHELKRDNLHTTLDFLGEEVASPKEAQQVAQHYQLILKTLQEQRLDVHISVKPTQLGLRIGSEIFGQHLRELALTAQKHDGIVQVDIEGSDTTSATLDVVRNLRKQQLPIAGAVQAMLRRTREDVTKLLESQVSLRLCKGAYKESPKAAYQDRDDIRRHYIALMKTLLASGAHHDIATHDEEIIAATKAFAAQKNISRDNFEFQMLYGIRPQLQRELAADGYQVRVYVPFGPMWLPYFSRRIRERKENAMFVLRNILDK